MYDLKLVCVDWQNIYKCGSKMQVAIEITIKSISGSILSSSLDNAGSYSWIYDLNEQSTRKVSEKSFSELDIFFL